MTSEDYRLALLSDRHMVALEARVSEEEDEVVEDLWGPEWAAGLDAADAAWGDR